MAAQADVWKTAKNGLAHVRSFGTLWLALASLGGFVVLVGGPWALQILKGIFGPAAAKPGRVITLDMIFTLPFAIYFFIQQSWLADGQVACPQCGEHYSKTKTSCPMCGAAQVQENKDA